MVVVKPSVKPIFHRRKCQCEEESSLFIYIGSETFTLLYPCELLRNPMTVAHTYEELKDKPDQQYGVKKLILAEWYQFCSYKKCLSK